MILYSIDNDLFENIYNEIYKILNKIIIISS